MIFRKRELKYHPVLLKESKGHYDTSKDSNIIKFEQQSTIMCGFGACNYNIIKYTDRDKGQDELDAKKRATFEAWRELLKDLLELGYSPTDNLRYVMSCEYPELGYSL